ncbi:MAG TPA: ABC transporter permease [Bryobacteraceae bacterium]|jgi:predicted permease|nr:ABC transporter permease [Bryobacteraceae bacterium]
MKRTPFWRRYARLLRPDVRADVDDELRFHLAAKVDELVAQGVRPDVARREAERQFGEVSAVQAEGERLGHNRERSKQRKDYWGGLLQDLRYALRTLRRDRAFTSITVVILALGIAANTAVFSVVDTVLLRPLPFPDSAQLTRFESGRELNANIREAAGLSGLTYTVGMYEEFQRHNQSFRQVTSYNPFYGNGEFTLTGQGEPQAVLGLMIAGNFFQTLGVQPMLGRLFTKEESLKGGRAATLLSYAFWQRQFAGDPNIVGQAILLNKTPFVVVGVMPPSFDFGSVFSPGLRIDLYVPAYMDVLRNWGNTLAIIGRLKPGVSVAQAQAEADILFPELKAAHKEWWGDYSSTITGLKEYVTGKLRRSLIVLWCAVGVILLIVGVNLSNLLLARAAARSKEFAMRMALGAGRSRLIRQLLTESLVLALGGALLGLALAFAITIYLSHQGSIALPLLSSIRLDGAALAWTILIAVVTAVLFGFAPALRMSTGNLQDALKDAGPGMSAGRRHERMRAALVISEVALACILLVGAGLLLRSFLRVLDVDLGFQPSHAAVIKVDYDDGGKRERRGAILREMLRNIDAIPGIEASGVADMLPLGRNRSWGFQAKGKQYPKDMALGALVRIVTPGYLAAMGMHLLVGRDFNWQDVAGRENAVIINQASARRFFPGEDPVGRLALVDDDTDTRVIGVIADVREHSLEFSAQPEMYLPAAQADPEGAELVIRTKLAPEALASSVMQTLRSLNPSQPAAEFRPLQQIVDHAVSPRRFFVMLVASFALLGLVLASLGIYGVISYSVTRQTQEIGIRMALGATAFQVQRGVIARALRLALAGVTLGTIGSFAAAKWIASLLFGTRPTDPATFAGIVVLLCAVALFAGYLPARRASRIDPMIALRTN